MPANSQWNKLALYDVLFIPDLHGNLLSVPQIIKHGAEVCFLGQKCQVFSELGVLIGKGQLQGNLFTISVSVITPPTAHITTLSTSPLKGNIIPTTALATRISSIANLGTWHQRLGHLATDAVL